MRKSLAPTDLAADAHRQKKRQRQHAERDDEHDEEIVRQRNPELIALKQQPLEVQQPDEGHLGQPIPAHRAPDEGLDAGHHHEERVERRGRTDEEHHPPSPDAPC